MSNKRPLQIPPAISTEDIELVSISNNPTDTIETLPEPTSVATRAGPPRKRFDQLNEGGQCFAIILVFLLGIGLLVQFHKLRDVAQVNVRPQDKSIPLFTLIGILACVGGAVLYGPPYFPVIVLAACFIPTVMIYLKEPRLMEWWDKMTTLFGILAFVIEYFVSWERDGRAD